MFAGIMRPFSIRLRTSLPIVILWVSLYYFNPARIVSEVPEVAPRWIEDGHQYETCSAAMSGTPVSHQTVAIDSARAKRIGVGVIESQTNLVDIQGGGIVRIGPSLVQRQFADGQSRLAWLYAEGKQTGSIGMDVYADFVYIDAITGAPLLLIKDMHAGDPNFTCPMLTFNSDWVSTATTSIALFAVGLAVSVVYVVGLKIIRQNSNRTPGYSFRAIADV